MDKELSYRAQQIMAKYVVIAKQHFQHSFAIPTINYRLKGKAAGKAYYSLMKSV